MDFPESLTHSKQYAVMRMLFAKYSINRIHQTMINVPIMVGIVNSGKMHYLY